MIPALRWAAMRAIFNVSAESDGTKSQDSVHKPQPFSVRKESRSGIEPRSLAYQPKALPLGQTGSRQASVWQLTFIQTKDCAQTKGINSVSLERRHLHTITKTLKLSPGMPVKKRYINSTQRGVLEIK